MTIHIGRNSLMVIAAVALVGVLAVAAGWIPLYPLLWLGLVLVCPLMMFLMMQGMHGGQEHGGDAPDEHHHNASRQ